MNKKLFFLWLISLVSVSHLTLAQQSQHEILKDYESGSFSVFKINEKGKFEEIKKKWPIQLSKSDENTTGVLVKRAGILDENFKPDVPGYPAYYLFQTFRLTFQPNYVAYYTWDARRFQAKAKYVFVKVGSSLNLKPEELNAKVSAYCKATFTQQTSARADVKDAKLTELAKYSIKGKEVAKIEVKLLNKPSSVAHFSPAIEYGVIATLKDGQVFKTKNLGGKMPWDDFSFKHTGASDTPSPARVDEDANDLMQDKIVLNVASKYNANIKASASLNATYDMSVQVNHNGYWGGEAHKHRTVFQGIDGQNADHAKHLTIKVVTITHKQTGERVNKIEIINTFSGDVLARFKLTPNTNLIVNAKGGNGMNGNNGRESRPEGGNGGRGGNGGNVTVLKDASVGAFSITINNQGGKGGSAGKGHYIGRNGNSGSGGSNGTTTTKGASVNLAF
jgi:hypothetical protein